MKNNGFDPYIRQIEYLEYSMDPMNQLEKTENSAEKNRQINLSGWQDSKIINKHKTVFNFVHQQQVVQSFTS